MKRAALLLLAPLLIGAADPRLVPDVSDQRIDIVYSFTGAQLLLFGAILYPGGRAPTQAPDVAIVITGPSQAVLLREKAKVAGIWMNRESARFTGVPSFYAVATSRPIDRILSPQTAAAFRIGIDNLHLAATTRAAPPVQARLEQGLIDLKRRSGLYLEQQGAVSIREGVLYRATIPIPARVPTGTYTARTYLLADGRVIARATRTVTIAKSGFERFVASAAQMRPALYGGTAVALSLLLGWLAAIAFGRFRR